jgi:hypothetical protein
MVGVVTATVRTNAPQVAASFDKLASNVEQKKVWLLVEIGTAFVRDVAERIKTADGGKWAPPSKWTRAKKGVNKALAGAEAYVKFRVRTNKMHVYADAPYSLSLHHRGFQNALLGKKEKIVKGRLAINIINPAPLGLKKAGPFYFIPRKAGITPPRRIWTSEGEQVKIGGPIMSRWLKNVVESTPGFK